MTPDAVAGRPRVLFRAPAGKRLGFGHLVRCVRLADALGVPCAVSVRARGDLGPRLRRLGATPVRVAARDLRSRDWDVLVVDDLSSRHAAPWLAAARRFGLLSVSIHDLGLGAEGADIAIDGSLGAPYRRLGDTQHAGPRFAVLGSAIRRPRGGRTHASVLVSLGGGARVTLATRLALAIRRRLPASRVSVAPGLLPAGPTLARWLAGFGVELVDPSSYRAALASAQVAVLAGGVSLYEAAAQGTPAVALAVVDAQRPTIRSFARAAIAVDGGRLRTASAAAAIDRVARAVSVLVADPARRREMARAGRRHVDGRGAARVAAIILSAFLARRSGDATVAGGV